MTFSDRLRRLRDKGGPNEITQIDLGIAMGIYKTPAAGQARIKRLESGAEPVASELIALSKVLHVSVYALLGLEGETENHFKEGGPSGTLANVVNFIPPEVLEVFRGNDVVLQEMVVDFIVTTTTETRLRQTREAYIKGKGVAGTGSERDWQGQDIGSSIDDVLDDNLLKEAM